MMLRRSINRLAGLVGFLFCTSSMGNEVTLEEVLKSTRRYFPKIAIEVQKKKKAEGKQLAKEGAFDLKIAAEGSRQPAGYYQRQELSTKLEQPTKLYGLNLYGGWRWSEGEFASYEGKRVTGNKGELMAGVQLPLLQGGLTDLGRTQIEQAGADVLGAEADVQRTLIDSLWNASQKYWKWTESVRKLEILEELLAMAMERQKWIETRVRLGDLPEYEKIDNQRTILDRKNKIVEAKRELQQSAVELSFYYRDPAGQPLLLEKELPAPLPEPKNVDVEEEAQVRLEKAILLRPEFQRLRAEMAAAKAAQRLAENSLLPTLDIYGEVAKDLGNVDATREPTEVRAGIRFKIPLQQRKAKGERSAAIADIDRLEQSQSFLRDQAKIDVQYALAALRATFEQVQLARQEVEVNKALVEGERIRFKQGDSHIMFVNLRELSLGGSRIQLNQSLISHQQALVALLAVTGELPQTIQD